MLSHLRNFDYILLIPVALLLCFGLLSLYSLSPISGDLFLKKQVLWVFSGIVAMVLVSTIDYRIFRTRGAVIFSLYIFFILLLGLLLLLGQKVRGIEGWFRLGDVLFQPAEFLKIILIILFAKYFSRRHIEIYRWRHIIISGLYVAVPAALLILQPDLGSVIVIFGIWALLMVFAGIPFRRLFVLLCAFLFTAGLLWAFVLHPYQKARITNFINPWTDARGGGYQTIQSMIAVGAGRITGEGLGYGTQSHLHFLPEPETDFIFATFAEEWGFVGSALLLSIYGFLFWRLLWLMRQTTNNFERLFLLGFLFLIFIEFIIHVGANTGILPITGLTLPFMSYGGSSLLSLFIGLGIIQSIQTHPSISLASD